ncbi:MAG: tetratricopeptide repeat protein [Bacteroidetes bacterium]|nr:tetratricopeptide repeat protein [Bacteroidota bacterium]
MNKKLALLIVAAAFVVNGTAQNVKIVNTKNYLREFGESKDIESLNKAKENIDLAAAHPDTKDLAKTQTLKAQVYVTIFDNSLRLENEKLTTITDPNKRNLAAYQNTSSAPLSEAFAACNASKAVDTKGNYTSEVANYIRSIAGHYENKAIADYNAKKYADALPSFEKAFEINGSKDSASLANCALVADRAANYEKAKLYYQKMIDNKQGLGNTYSSLVNVYLMMKDSVGGMDVLKKGRAAYPNDINLVITETNYFLKTNNSKEALNNLNIALAAKPADANLYLVRGNIYDNLANPKDAAGKDMEKPKDYDEKINAAEADYKKAVELKPDYFDALYNLGILYNNKGVALNKKADMITDNVKYKAENDKATAEFNKAIPVLEKALEVSPKDRNTMYALKQVYARTQQADKLKAITERLKNN